MIRGIQISEVKEKRDSLLPERAVGFNDNFFERFDNKRLCFAASMQAMTTIIMGTRTGLDNDKSPIIFLTGLG